MPLKLKAVLFDLDGTLLDTAPDMAGALNALRAEHGLTKLPYDGVRAAVSHGGARVVRTGFPHAGPDEAARLLRRFLDIYRGALSQHTSLFAGMPEVLATLDARGIVVGIVTNKPAWLTDPLLEELDLRSRFACVVSGDTLAERKPHPRPLLHAAQLAGVTADACVYVGDAERDIQAAHAAGMPGLVATYGYLLPEEDSALWQGDAYLQQPLDLLAWLNGQRTDVSDGIDWSTWLVGLTVGLLVGVLAAALWRTRREQTLRIDNEVLRARLKSEEDLSAERDSTLQHAREQLQGVFGNLARDSLQSNSELFLQLARERLSHQHSDAAQTLKERETAIESMVRPIREALERTEAQIHSIERDRISSFATIKAQMDILATGQSSLSRETRNLVSALHRPDVRGQWGEMTLRRLVELSGMTAHVDFTEQLHVATDSGAMRPDMVVHMPEQRDIVVDVKTPLEAYLAAVEAQDDEQRTLQLRRHAQIVATRIRELASKQYWSQFARGPDFVILFLPGEQFLSAALQESPGLMDEAMRQNVMLATPTSLVALLKAVSYGWKQTQLAQSAGDIRQLGEEIYKRLAVFGEHLGKLGRSLNGSVDSFNKAVGSLEQQVLPAARKFPELGLRVTRDIEVIEPIVSSPRVPRGTLDIGKAEGSAPEST